MPDPTRCPKCSSPDIRSDPDRRARVCNHCDAQLPPAPLRIFLSYGHDANEPLVRRIMDDLKNRGHDVWFDKDEIRFGDDWRRSITDGIARSNRVLSFLSKYSTRDPGVCRDEIAIAIGVKGGNIQTILVESEAEVQPPVNIGHIQWLDMHEWREREAANGPAWDEWYQAKFAEVARVVESDESARFAGEIETLSVFLKPISSDARVYELLRKGFIGREWLFDAVEKWRIDAQRGSRLLWISGAPGVGKSAFAAQLAHTRSASVIAAQFVEWDKPDHRDPRRIILSIAFQLATRLPDYRKLLLTLPEINELDRKTDSAGLFDYLLSNPLKLAISGNRERYLIVIDALDEAGDSDRNPLVEILARNAPRLPEWVGIVVTGRPESSVKAPLQGLSPILLATETDSNRSDLRAYLEYHLAAELAPRHNANQILNYILDKSEGIFLYVERFCDDVSQGHLSLDHPDHFPQGLGGVYCDYFIRQFPDIDRFRKNIRPALRTILAAREPLPFDILPHLLTWSREELYDFTSDLSSLFQVRIDFGVSRIKPFHKSLTDWLTEVTTAGPYYVDAFEGHKMLAEYGLRTLDEQPDNISEYILNHLPKHLCEAGNTAGLISILLNPKGDYFERWAERGMAAEGIQCLEFLFPRIAVSSNNQELLPIISSQLGRLYNRLADPAAAELWLAKVIELRATIGEYDPAKAVTWHELGSAALSSGNYSAAHKYYRRALGVSRRTKPPLNGEIGPNLIGLAVTTYLTSPRPQRTACLAKLALRHAEERRDAPHVAEACRIIADVLKDDLQIHSAEDYLARGLRVAEEYGLTTATLSLLTSKAWLIYQCSVINESSPKDAEAAFRTLLQLAEQTNDWRFQADAWCGLGQIAVLKQSEALLETAITKLIELDLKPAPKHILARMQLYRADRTHLAGQFSEARRLYITLDRFSQLNCLWSRQVDAILGHGATLLHSGDPLQAASIWDSARPVLRLCPRNRQELFHRSLTACQKDPRACPL